MNSPLFFALEVINFESDLKDFDDLHEEYTRRFGYVTSTEFRWKLNKHYSHWLYKVWRSLYRHTFNPRTIDRILTKIAGEHISIGDVTIYGYNAMQWAVHVRLRKGTFAFRPPHVRIFPFFKFMWGRCYYSPDGTPSHQRAKHLYGSNFKLKVR